MKRILYISTLLVMALSSPLQAQVTIGSDKQPEPYSVLEMDSEEGGMRLNQIDKPSKTNVTTKLNTASNRSLTNGLTIFDTEANKIQYWDGLKWAQSLSVEANEDAEGLDGQFLMSNGSGKYPEWATLNIPKVQTGDFYLYSSAVRKDMKGVNLAFIKNDYEQYPEDLILNGSSKNWYEIKGLETNIVIPDVPENPGDPSDKVYTRLVVEMQTGAQMRLGPNTASFEVNDIYSGSKKVVVLRDNSWVSFTIGIFIGNQSEGYKLKQVRSFRLDGSAVFPFDTFTLIGAVDNLPPGEHTIKVAAKRRGQADFMKNAEASDILLSVGRPSAGADVTNYNNFMAQSFFRANVYAIYD